MLYRSMGEVIMTIFKRIFLFLAVNILVILTISCILSIFNISPYLSGYGLDYQSLMIFCSIWGMAGAFISLLLSKKMAKWMMGVKVLETPRSSKEEFLLNEANNLARDAKLPNTPEIGIYNSPEVNAFATGATKASSLIAVSSGLLNNMQDDQIKAILAHEMGHISNGDMVTMTLLQGVINAFVMFFARAIAFFLSGRNNKSRGSSFMSYYFFTFIFEAIFMILGSVVICFFSRKREYLADLQGAQLTSKQDMISALRGLQNYYDIKDPKKVSSLNAFKISNNKENSFLSLFATHPSLKKRIEKLKELP
jgi:heat shock protein HtpX